MTSNLADLEHLEDQYRFKVIRKLAQGGMGAVYLVEQEGVDGFSKIIAMKTLLPDLVEDPEFRRLFVGEAKLVADLVHPNIVQIHQLSRVGDLYYIAMEYVEGVNLAEFLSRHRRLRKTLPQEMAVFIASRICRGLAYAHTKRDACGNLLGIVHRDITPKNILINNEGEVKIVDFGIAKAARIMEQEETEVLMGKLGYMSPEQADYQVTDARSDIFSVGVILWEMLLGENPLMDENTIRSLERLKSVDITGGMDVWLKKLPDALGAIVRKALERLPADRFQTAAAMGGALERYIYGSGYGPTIVALARYMIPLFPERRWVMPPDADE